MPWPLLAQLVRYLRPYAFRLVLVVVCTLIAIASEGLGLSLFIPLLTLIFGGGADAAGGFLTQHLTSIVRVFPPAYAIELTLGAIGFAVFCKATATYAASYLTDWTRYRLVTDLRIALQENLTAVAYRFITATKPGDVLFAFSTEAIYAGVLLAHIFKFATATLTAVAFLGLMVLISWQLTLLAFAFAFLIGLSVQFTVRRTRARARDLTRIEAELSEAAHESWGAMRLARSMGTTHAEIARIANKATESFRAVLRKARYYNATLPMSEFLGALGLIAIIAIGMRGDVRAAPVEILGMTIIIVRLLPYVSSINQTRSQIAADAHYVDRLLRLIARTDKPYLPSGERRIPAIREGITFSGVTFRYEHRTEPALRDITCTIPYGKMTAIVGASGSGKSTLLDLVLRLHDPTEGTILVDGVDLRTIDIMHWCSRIGVVSQQSFIFNATIAENLRYAKPDATLAELQLAAQHAYIHDFIMELPKGYDTRIGERGVLCSGGQQQRLAIARAILRDPELLMFDEATSALDHESEQYVQRAIRELAANRTVLVVAHRLSTIACADHIVVLSDGRIAECGRHTELVARNGMYADLYRTTNASGTDASVR